MSRPRGTDDNPNQTQEISRIRKQNVVKEMVGLDIQKKKSDVWTVFEKLKDKDGNVLAKCSLCKILFNGSSKQGTTRLRLHFNSCQRKRNEGGASGSGDKPAGNSVTDQQLDHLDRNHFNSCQNKRNEGGASGSGDKPAGNSVTDQQLNHLDINQFNSCQNKRNEGGDKPSGNSVTDQQLNHLDWVKMLIKQCDWDLPNPKRDADIMDIYNKEKEKLRIYFEKLCCRFSLTTTNVANGKYTCFVVLFIDDDWKLEEKIIGFKCIEGDQNMEVLKNVLLDLGIDNKISSMVIDGDSDICVLSSDDRENWFSGQGSFLSNCKFCACDFYDIAMTCPDFVGEMRKVLHDHMSKISNYIRETSSNIGTFRLAIDRARSSGKEVTAEDIPPEEMFENMSWLDLLTIAFDLKEAFFELENIDPNFTSINLTKEQWDVITTFYQFGDDDDFEEIYWELPDCKTANLYFPVLCRLYKKSLVLVTLNSFISFERHLRFIRDARKCWDEYNLILAVAAVLDPRFKMDIVKHWYKKIYGDRCETRFAIFTNYFTSVCNEYAKGTNNFQSYGMLDISGYSSYDVDGGQSLSFELYLYFKEVNFPLIKNFDILEWWRVYSRHFPTLAKMARDFLSIQITVPLRNITKYGHGSWSSVPKQAGLQRCGKSRSLRWINYLRPNLKRGTFSPEEENLIIQLHALLGDSWSLIAARLPGRTDNEIKNLWNSCLKKKLRQRGFESLTL